MIIRKDKIELNCTLWYTTVIPALGRLKQED
jgi:hypothetical protein